MGMSAPAVNGTTMKSQLEDKATLLVPRMRECADGTNTRKMFTAIGKGVGAICLMPCLGKLRGQDSQKQQWWGS